MYRIPLLLLLSAAISPIAISPMWISSVAAAALQSNDGEEDSAEPDEPKPIPPTPEPKRIEIKVPSEEHALVAWLRDLHQKVPDYVGRLNKEKREQVAVVVESLVLGGKHYLDKYPQGADRVEVLCYLAHALCMNRARALKAIKDEYKEASGEKMSPEDSRSEEERLQREIYAFTDQALQGNPPPHQIALVRQVCGELKSAEGRWPEAIDSLRKSVAAEPNGSYAEASMFSLIACSFHGGEHATIREMCERFLDQWPRSPRVSEVIQAASDSYYRRGMLEEGREYISSILPMLVKASAGEAMPARGNDPGGWVVPEPDRKGYRTQRDLAAANLGFFAFARFDYEEAKRQLELFISGDAYPPTNPGVVDPTGESVDVTRKFIVLPLLTTLNSLVGKECPPLASALWVLPPRENQPKPKARALVLASLDLALGRQQDFMRLLAKLQMEQGAAALEITWLSSLGRMHPGETMEMKHEALRKAAADLGITGAIGFDQEHAIHEALYMVPGTASFYVMDGDNKIVWQALDPMGWSEGLIRRIFRQVLGEP